MRNIAKYIVLITTALLIGQENYRSVDQIKSEWSEHTTYQRDEMISFCDFLFNEGHYERSLIACFQFLYRYPEDQLKPVVLYYIAKSYEAMGNYTLARRYYNRVMKIEDDNSISYKASKYRETYSYLMENNIGKVQEITEGKEDPYFLILRAYSYFQTLEWEEARTLFISAEEKFDHRYYSKLMIPLYQAIENVSEVPQHNRAKVAIGGMFLPGGGQMVLKDWKNGQGIFTTAAILYLIYSLAQSQDISAAVNFANSPGLFVPEHKGVNDSFELTDGRLTKAISSESSLIKYTIPPIIIGSFIHLGSLFKSMKEIKKKNKSLIQYYALDNIESISPERFLDFQEPVLINKNK